MKMKVTDIEHLVIFSTLNQITNYIAIKALRPKKIHNITFSGGLCENFKYGINPSEWDENLKCVLKKDKDIEGEVEKIEITNDMYEDLEKFKKKLLEKIEGINEDTPIYWHVTGGQRVFAMAIYDIVNSRPNDILFYIEGNTEKIICMGKNKENKYQFESGIKYELKDLDFNTALQLMGYDTKELESTKILKEKGENKIVNSNDVIEKKFYNCLYQWMVNEGRNEIIQVDGQKGKFKKLLLLSNSIKKYSNEKVRQEFLKKLFKEVKSRCPGLETYNIEESEEMKKGFPAGYIFEKLVGYKIFEVIEGIKDNPKILGMDMSLKIYKEKFNHCVDELDIALLTNTGRILNFECKSGSLEGDNAKSHHFTTYALSGVFGAPIFMTPLFENEDDLKDNINDKLVSAIKAAEKAKIKTIYLDKIEYEIKNLLR